MPEVQTSTMMMLTMMVLLDGNDDAAEVQTSTMMMSTMMILLDGNDDAADVEKKMQLRPASSGVADVDSSKTCEDVAVGELDEILRVREAKP